MNSIKKFMKSKTPAEAIDNISFNAFNIAAFVLMLVFICMPVCKLVYDITLVDIFPVPWSKYNLYVLAIGLIFLILYVIKIVRMKKYRSVGEFFSRNRAFALFGVFIILMIISTAVNGFTHLGLFSTPYRREGLFGYMSYFVYFSLAYISCNRKLIRAFFCIFTGSASVLAIFPMIDFFSKFDRFSIGGADYLFYQYNHYGYYLLMSMITAAMLFITEKKLSLKILFIIEFAIAVFGLLINDTFGCQLAAIVTLIFIAIVYSLHKGKFKPITLFPIAVFAFTALLGCIISNGIKTYVINNYFQFTVDTDALTNGFDEDAYSTGISRIRLWKYTLSYISEKPLLGFAAEGTGERLYTDVGNDIGNGIGNDRCHCEYLQYAVNYGIPAAIIYIAGIMTVYLRGLIRRKQLSEFNLIGLCVGFAYLVSAVVGNSMFYTAPFLFIMLGFGYSLYSPGNENPSDELKDSVSAE